MRELRGLHERQPHPDKHLFDVCTIENQREGEAPAELAPPWFGRSLTLPGSEFAEKSRCGDVQKCASRD